MAKAMFPGKPLLSQSVHADDNSRKHQASYLLVTSLETENEILKSEVISLNQLSTDLRAQVSRLEASLRSQFDEATSRETAKLAAEVATLQARLESREQSIELLTERNSVTEQKARELETSLQDSRHLLQQGFHELQRVCSRSSQYLDQWLNFIQDFIIEILPTFKSMIEGDQDKQLQQLLMDYTVDKRIAEIQIPDDFNLAGPAYAAAESQLNNLLLKVDASLNMLQQVVLAKLETVNIIRNKVKDENVKLHDSLEMLQSKHQSRETQFLASQHDFEEERNVIKGQVKELQQLYKIKLEEMETRLLDARQRAQYAERDNQELKNQGVVLGQNIERMQARIVEFQQKLVTEEELRAKLIVDMTDMKKQHELQSEELNALKTQQKLLGLRDSFKDVDLTCSRLSVSGKEESLVRMVDKLLAENVALKEDIDRLNIELLAAKKQSVQTKYMNNAINNREVDMVIEQKVPDSELTSKILRRNLQQQHQDSCAGAATSQSVSTAQQQQQQQQQQQDLWRSVQRLQQNVPRTQGISSSTQGMAQHSQLATSLAFGGLTADHPTDRPNIHVKDASEILASGLHQQARPELRLSGV